MMKRLLLISIALILTVGNASALSTAQAVSIDHATSIATGTKVFVKGMTTAVYHVCCTFQGTVTFLATVDGDNYEKLACVDLSTNSGYTTTATARGLYRCNITGINTAIRADITEFLGGTVSVVIGLTSGGIT